MKKILATLVVLTIICASVFAVDVSLNLGAGCTLNNNEMFLTKTQKEPDGEGNASTKLKYKSTMFDAELGVEVEFDNQLTVYETVGFGLPSEIEFTKTVSGDEYSGKLKINKSLYVSDAIGVGYKFHFGDFDLLTAGGIYGDIMSWKAKENSDVKGSFMNLGLNLNLKGTYKFSEHLGVMLALRPSFNIYNSWSITSGEKLKADGAKFGTALAGVLGMEYKF